MLAAMPSGQDKAKLQQTTDHQATLVRTADQHTKQFEVHKVFGPASSQHNIFESES